ncbi:MAG: ABC transporter ATP-binding protein [Campylobacterota bacterium]|nr:ABC transporter ATP-binding protein [Campylobacterota bacterium]
MHSNSIVSVEKLSFSYNKDKALEDINLDVKFGDFLAIIGPNGGGKSTLVNIILGLLTPQEGKITLFNGDAEDANSIGYVPQNTNVNINFPIRVIDVILMGVKEKKHFFGYSKKSKEYANELLKQVGMSEYAYSKIGSLSGGQRQRVMIARALSLNPKLLILDEPTSSIDADGQSKIYELLKELNNEITIIVISHDLSVIIKYASKVAHVNKKLSFHDVSKMQNAFSVDDEHFCEVELLQLIGEKKCPTC